MKKRRARPLPEKYPPSEPCSCSVCRAYCSRPGWWTVSEAERAVAAGYAGRMMLEMAPDRSFGVLSPAFRGCEENFALQEYAENGCTFYRDGLCQLYGTGFEPLECRFCHHTRQGLGRRCHADLEREWSGEAGQRLVSRWIVLTGLYRRYGLLPR